jgi:hypothetical protein
MKYIDQPIPLEEIVRLIGEPDLVQPYVNPNRPDVPTGATEERWNCGCRATPAGFGSPRRTWRRERCRRQHGRLEVG